jgi:hypothetical protein
MIYIQISQAVLEKPPDFCLVASKWHQLIHPVFFSLVGYNLCLDDQMVHHDGSHGVWFNVKGYRGLVVFKDK